jgi:2-C-methyl-D-erythritol 4-phosphate cytidylyltransferase
MKNIALITAAGRGERINQDIPKQFIHINNKPIVLYTLEAFEKHPSIDYIIVVCLDGWQNVLWAYTRQFNISKLKWIVNGGTTGHDSIHNGLMELKKHCDDDDIVLIHDGNRALVSQEIISEGLSIYAQYGSSVAAIPCTEVIMKSSNGNIAEEEFPREQMFRTQTPHIFCLSKLIWAHNEVEKRKIVSPSATCSLMQMLGEQVYFSFGSEKNLKITTLDDLEMFKALLNVKKDSWLK